MVDKAYELAKHPVISLFQILGDPASPDAGTILAALASMSPGGGAGGIVDLLTAIRDGILSTAPVNTIGHATPFRRGHQITTAKTNFALLAVNAGTRICITQFGAKLSTDVSVAVAVRAGFASTTLPAATEAGNDGIICAGKYVIGSVPGEKEVGAPTLGNGADGEDLLLTCDVPTGGILYILYSGYLLSP